MPSKSKAQQKFMGMVHALKKGEMNPKDASPELKKAAQSMKKSDAKDFASTKHKGLPKKVKQEILNKLKEYASKMGTNTLGGDDYTTSRKGGLRDFDGYDNVDYNKDMPMDESADYKYLTQTLLDAKPKYNVYYNSGHNKVNIGGVGYDGGDLVKNFNQKPGSSSKIKNNFYHADQDPQTTKREVEKLSKGKIKVDIQKGYGGKSIPVYIVKESVSEGMFSTIDHIKQNSKSVRDFIKNVLSDKDFRDMKNDKDFIKYLGSIYEGKLPNNWMSGRTSDYHTSLRGKKRDYDDTNFKKDNSGQPDLEEDGMKKSKKNYDDWKKTNEATKPDFNSKGYKEASKLVAKLRSSVFKKMSDTDLDQFRMVLAQAFDLKEYGSRLTEPFLLPKDEDKLDGTPPSKDAIDRVDEIMITLTQNIAKDIIPMNTWSRYSSDGKKNAEFVKNLMRDLTQTLNKFYKSHNINVRVKEK